MAWQFPISISTTSTTIDLSTSDSIFVAPRILVACTGSTSAIRGTGTGQIAEIYGAVLTNFESTIWLGGATTVLSSESVYVGDTGWVESKGLAAVNFWGAGNSLVNDGMIKGARYGVFLSASTVSDENVITNNDRIQGKYGVTTVGDAAGVARLVNTGTITGSIESYGSDRSAQTKDIITNNGKMIGLIDLDGGDDVYHGEKGSVKGAINGGDGADQIYGGSEKNTIDGGAGADKLYGGKGADNLTGGADADVFLFKASAESVLADSGRDTIMDFKTAENDTIDLHFIDANTKKSGNQAFAFIDAQQFHNVAGELRFKKADGDTFVYGDTNGDGKADFSVKLEGLTTLHAGDFVL